MCTKGQLASKRTAVTKAAPYSLIPDLLLCHACFCFNFNNSQINIIFAIVSKTKTIKNNLARSKKKQKNTTFITHISMYLTLMIFTSLRLELATNSLAFFSWNEFFF